MAKEVAPIMMMFSRTWFIAGTLLAMTALAAGILLTRETSAQFVTPTSGMYAAIDCDIVAPGIQDECVLPANTTSVAVAIVLGNADTPESDISAIQTNVLANQRVLEPAIGADSNKDANPDFEDASFPSGTWSCTPPAPARDVNPDPLIADSFLSCYQSEFDGGEPFNAGSQVRAAIVRYDVARTGTADIRLDRFSVGDTAGAEVMSCSPAGEVPTQCFGARVQIGLQTPTPTFTSTATPPPGSTATPTATATIAENPTVTPTSTSVPTAIATPVLDTDMDGVLDAYELAHPCMTVGVVDGEHDPDFDGLTNIVEAALLTDACNPDSDFDTLPDGFEVTNTCLNPLEPATPGEDSDADGLTDVQEFDARTLPCDPDSDRDGYSDGLEVSLGEDPLLYCNVMRADVSNDRRVSAIDLMLVAQQFGPTPPGNPRMDQGNDARVSSLDLLRVAIVFGRLVQSCE